MFLRPAPPAVETEGGEAARAAAQRGGCGGVAQQDRAEKGGTRREHQWFSTGGSGPITGHLNVGRSQSRTPNP